MSEKPIERLNYFNGQRLEASDLRLEQEYHIQIQRWLMKTLFSPGVAKGFDVKVLEGRKKILLEPGLALDDLGRAIILVAPVELTPQARLLCIRYAEHKQRPQSEAGCAANVGGGATVPARWGGGPERILSQPDIFWRADPPRHDTRELVIAELLLKADCSVEKVVAGAKRRASPLPVQQVHQISLEGEKDIAKDNPKLIHFFIRGGRPNSVTLYLRAKEFSSLHYSEMGEVTPVITGLGGGVIQTEEPSDVDAHSHDGGTLATSVESHTHDVLSRVFKPNTSSNNDKGLFIAGGGNTSLDPMGPIIPPLNIQNVPVNIPVDPVSLPNLDPNLKFSVVSDSHKHLISGKTASTPEDKAPSHTHEVKVEVSTTGQAGQTAVRSGNQFLHFSNLKIGVGKKGSVVDRTGAILRYVRDSYPAGNQPTSIWSGQGSFSGQPTSPLYGSGTGPIRLDLIDGLSFEPDEYVPYEIKLYVEQIGDGGGCLQYNLYVE